MFRKTSRKILSCCAMACLGVVASCTFQVVSPAALQTTSQDFEIAGGKLRINVVFNSPVNLSSLVAGTNVILVTEKDANADITIAAGSTSYDIVITTVADYGDLLTFDPDGFFTLRLLGSGGNPVTDSGGAALDGDANGSAGGDYETTFVLIG